MPASPACPSCSAPLRADQRYCLHCGHTVASVLEELRSALAGAPEDAAVPAAGRASADARAPASPRRRRLRVAGVASGVLTAGLAIGILTGGLINPSSNPLAAPLLELVVHAPAATTTVAQSTPAAVSAGPPLAPPPAPSGAAAVSTAPATPTSASTSTTTTPATTTTTTTTTPTPVKLPKIHHVWLISLTDQAYGVLYAPASAAHYLGGEAEAQATLLTRYYATAHGALADEIAMLSGQGPTRRQQQNCPTYDRLTPGMVPSGSATKQVRGTGCVFPAKIHTLVDQLTAKRLGWRAYVAGQATGTGGSLATCRHPQLGAADSTAADPSTATTMPTDGYLTWRNPFMYFSSITRRSSCAEHDVGLSQLAEDLASGHAPAFSWIAPDACSAGAAAACPGDSSAWAIAALDLFLRTWIPKIQATRAYRKDGMIVVVADEAPDTGPAADSSACCRAIHYLNTDNPGGIDPGPGGGRVGALVISRFATQAGTDATRYDHFSLLRTLEDIFKVAPLGYAQKRAPFGAGVFPSENGGSSTP